MRYKTSFTVIYSEKTGKIIEEIWIPLRRLCWPLPWVKLPGNPSFGSYEELSDWFEKVYPGKNLMYIHYGKSKSV